jgi:hypothetical protein
MHTLAISIDMPPQGDLETSGNGSELTDGQMAEELAARQDFLDRITPFLQALPGRPLHREGNVSRAELLGASAWSQLNHYLLILAVDIGGAEIGTQLARLLPAGAQVSVRGEFESLQVWPAAPAEPSLASSRGPATAS